MKLVRARSGVLVALLWFSLLVWAISGLAFYLRLTYLILFLLIGSALGSYLSFRGIRFKRTVRSRRAMVGDVLEEQYEVFHAGLFPCLWLEIRNLSPLPGDGGSRLLTNLRPRRRRFYTARYPLLKRGLFPLGPTTLMTGDLFGLYTFQRSVPANHTLLVLPMLFDLPHFLPSVGQFTGGKLARIKTTDLTPHAAGLRDYAPADPLRRIHWPSTAKRGHLMVKEFERESEAETWIFLDAQSSAHVCRLPSPAPLAKSISPLSRPRIKLAEDTLEYAVSIVASVANRLLRRGFAVGLVCSTRHTFILPPERGERQRNKIMEALALLQANGETSFWSLLSAQGQRVPPGNTLILITPTVKSEIVSTVEHLHGRRLSLAIILLHAQSFGGPSGSEALSEQLRQRGQAVWLVRCGDDLNQVLRLNQNDRTPIPS